MSWRKGTHLLVPSTSSSSLASAPSTTCTTSRGRKYQEFIEDISSTKKKRRSHRSGEEEEEPEVEMEALHTEEPCTSPPPHHWKKQWKQRAGSPRGREEPAPARPPLAKQEPTTATPQFDLDAKMEKIEPLKLPDTFAKGRAGSGGPGKPPPGQGRGARSSLPERATGHALTTAHPTRAFDSRPNKKSR